MGTNGIYTQQYSHSASDRLVLQLSVTHRTALIAYLIVYVYSWVSSGLHLQGIALKTVICSGSPKRCDTDTLCKHSVINTGNTQIARQRGGSIAREGGWRSRQESVHHTQAAGQGLCVTGAVFWLSPSALPSLSPWKVTFLPNRTHTLFLSHSVPKHYNIPFHTGTKGGFRASCRVERKGGDPTACQHTPLELPKKQEGWFGQCMTQGYFAQNKADISVHTPTTHPGKGQHEVTAWKLIQTALNFNSQPSRAQSPLITTRPMNVRCLEWKQSVKIPVWDFSWKSVIENHLSVRQN